MNTFPCMHRHTLGARVTESLLDAQMHVFHAQPLDGRLQRIEAAQASISLKNYTLRVLVDIQALTKMNSYLGLSGPLAARRWERKWLKSLDPSWWRFLRHSGQKMVIARWHRRNLMRGLEA